jgi:Zn-dependent metalloprotease
MVPIGRDRRTGEVVTAPDWHVVAGIPNKAAAIIGDELGRDTMGKIYLKAVRENVHGGKEIEGLATAVLKSAKDLYGVNSREFQVTKDAWDQVGVLELLQQQAGAR